MNDDGASAKEEAGRKEGMLLPTNDPRRSVGGRGGTLCRTIIIVKFRHFPECFNARFGT